MDKFWFKGGIGSCFFKNEAVNAVSLNGFALSGHVEKFFLAYYWWHGGEWYVVSTGRRHMPCSHWNIEFMRTKFPDWIISRNFAVNLPSKSYVSTLLDYFLWGYVKDQVYADSPESIEDFKTNIRCVIAEIEPQLYKKCNRKFCKNIDVCKRDHGGHLLDIIFHS